MMGHLLGALVLAVIFGWIGFCLRGIWNNHKSDGLGSNVIDGHFLQHNVTLTSVGRGNAK